VTGVPVARIFGIEVRVQVGWVVILALIGFIAVSELELVEPQLDERIGWILGALIAIGFFLSSAAHDLAHAVMARRRGLQVSSIVVSFFGGSTPVDPTASNPRDDFAIAVAGPVVSICLGILCAVPALIAGLADGVLLETVAAVLGILTVLNFILGFVNLLPAYPLDGGRVIRALGWRRGGSLKSGWRAASRSGRFTGFAAIALGVGVMVGGGFTNGAMLALSGWFLVWGGRSIADRIRVEDLIGGLHVEDAMEPDPVSVGPGLTVDTFGDQLLDGDSPMTAVAVVSDERIVGVLGLKDVRRLRRNRWPTTRVEEVMAKPPRLALLTARESLATAVERLQRSGLDGLPVVDGNDLVGLLTRRSVGKLLHDRGLLSAERRPAG
jgi:Zn-dependent protease/CBS domain-containing protein